MEIGSNYTKIIDFARNFQLGKPVESMKLSVITNQFIQQKQKLLNDHQQQLLLNKTPQQIQPPTTDLDKVATQTIVEEINAEDYVTKKNQDQRKNRGNNKFMIYYPISGKPFFSFSPKLEIADIVKK